MSEELRRVDDQRFEKLDDKIDRVQKDVSSIRDMLITEPEASPLGRSLLNRSRDNRQLIDDLREDFERFRDTEFKPIEDWWQQTKGAWRFIIGVGVVLGIVGAFFGVLAFYGIRGA